MGLFVCMVLPVLLIFLVLWLCKKYNFSIFPKGMKLPPPEEFKMPKIRRRKYTWEEDSESESDSEDDLTSSPYGLYHPDKISGDFEGAPKERLGNIRKRFNNIQRTSTKNEIKRDYMRESEYNDMIDGGLYD